MTIRISALVATLMLFGTASANAAVTFFSATGYGEAVTRIRAAPNAYYFNDGVPALADVGGGTFAYSAEDGRAITIQYLPPFGNPPGEMLGTARSLISASLNPTMTRVSVTSVSSSQTAGAEPRFVPGSVSDSYVGLSAGMRDRLTFNAVPGVTTAILRVTTAAQMQLVQNVEGRGAQPSATSRGTWSYSTDIRTYNDSNHVFGTSGIVKQIRQTLAGSGTNSSNGCNNIDFCFINGTYMQSTDFIVDLDDVLYTSSLLSLERQTVTEAFGGPFRSQIIVTSKWDFSNSAYTLLEWLTPGFDYVSESGVRYLTALPAAEVSQPTGAGLFGAGLALAALARLRRPKRSR